MSSLDLQTRWHFAALILKRARLTLPYKTGIEFAAKEKEFNEFIEHNELGLALAVLEELAEMVPCRGGFWKDLERAAVMMELAEHKDRFHARFLASRPPPNQDKIPLP